ncbi:MAG: helicase C-terminal domain-containing protein [Candidatus Pacearchaeota archaeon]
MIIDNKKNDVQSKLMFNSDGSIILPESIEKELENDLITLEMPDVEEDYSKVYNIEDNVHGFNLYNGEKKLGSLKFSNGKNQEDIVNEVVSLIKSGKKVIFIKGMCGTGKSAIALNIAKELGRASIVVPGKALQKQYMDDYSKEKYVLKNDHKKLKIKVITGRENHKCLFKKEANADDNELPCKIEIKEKNSEKIREYLKANPKIRLNLELKDVRRISIAPVCPYWSPIVPEDKDLNLSAVKKTYKGMMDVSFTIYQRKHGCPYYAQFNSYIDSEVIVFNSAKYLLESVMNRKPNTDVEIIDECDEFLDSFSNMASINLTRFLNSLNYASSVDYKSDIKKISSLLNDVMFDYNINNTMYKNEIFELKHTKFFDLFKIILDNQEVFDSADEDNYCYHVLESVLMFEDFLDETYIRYRQEERNIFIDLVTINLEKKFSELAYKNKALVLMSGTLHSERVLKEIFGVYDFNLVEAENQTPGKIEILKTGFELDCKYDNFLNNSITRESYLIALDKAVEKSLKPSLVHVQSFNDLPDEREKESYNLKNLISKNELISKNNNEEIIKFKKKEIRVLFTTKCARGIDFPGDQCNSIIFTKYPNPDASSIFWRILRKIHPDKYWEFYNDKASRDFLQKIYRGVRFKEDHVYVLSPDIRVLNAVETGNFK